MLKPGKHWYLPLTLATFAFVLGPLGAASGVLEPILGFKIFALSGFFGVVSLLWGLRMVVATARGKGLISMMVGVVPLAIIAVGLVNGSKLPPINDISTDLDNPPKLVAALGAADNAGKDLAYPEDFKAKVRTDYPDLISKPLPLPTKDAFAKVIVIAGQIPGWTIVRTDPATMTIEGSETSALFKFVDDFVIRVEPLGPSEAEGGKSLVAMRSRSRVGKGDFGVNAARIRRFFAALEP